MNHIGFVGNAILVPFFLPCMGMLVDPAVLVSNLEVWLLAGAVTALLVAGKLAAAFISGRLFGFSPTEMATVAGLTIGQAAAALAITVIGHGLGRSTP
jgi:Kef-type K+ transport system membrane component KefB